MSILGIDHVEFYAEDLTACAPGHPAADYIGRHGDGVASIAFRTDADRDKRSELFQIFTRSTHERGTFFIELIELIERRGALTSAAATSRPSTRLSETLGDERGSKAPAASRD